jgi:hypothetical protein
LKNLSSSQRNGVNGARTFTDICAIPVQANARRRQRNICAFTNRYPRTSVAQPSMQARVLQ